LSQAVRWNLLAVNPVDRVEPPRVRIKEVEPIDEVRAACLIEMDQGTRLYLPVVLAIYTGMRRGEILAVRWGDIDLEMGYLLVRRALDQYVHLLPGMQEEAALKIEVSMNAAREKIQPKLVSSTPAQSDLNNVRHGFCRPSCEVQRPRRLCLRVAFW
jgi:integrase